MSTEATPDRIAKLPVWAREYIQRIERERETAIETLREFTDNQTPSKCYADNFVSTGERGRFGGPSSIRSYFNAKEAIVIENAGIKLDVCFYEDDCITLRYRGEDNFSRDVAIVPVCHNSIKLVAKDNLRS